MCNVQSHSRQRAVQLMPRQARCDVHCQTGVDGQQTAVEQAVHIRPHHQTFFQAVVLRVGERPQVSRLQHLEAGAGPVTAQINPY